MKAFLVGLLFLIAVLVMASLGFLLYPLLLVTALLLRLLISIALLIFAIWILGKFIIWVWESLRGK